MVFTKDSHYESERAVILIKAAPQTSSKHGETVCCAGITPYGEWRRLYPISFRFLTDDRKFSRWDVIEYRSSRPIDDRRDESRRVDSDSLMIVSNTKKTERWNFLQKSLVTSLQKEKEANRSLALLEVEVLDFTYERMSDEKFAKQKASFDALHSTADMFETNKIIPYEPCPYEFKYRYLSDDGIRTGTCQDWEVEATYYRMSRKDGERAALDYIVGTFGERYPREGMCLAMGTHSIYPDTWLINGIIKLERDGQGSLF